MPFDHGVFVHVWRAGECPPVVNRGLEIHVAEVDAESGLEGTNGYAPDREFYQRRIQTISRSGSSASTLDVALRAVALGFKGRAGWIVTRSAGGLAGLRGLV